MALTSRRTGLRVKDVVGGRFRLDAELAEGGMSRVYEAVDLKYDRPAAVKVLARWLADDDEFRQRFERESYAAERVTHPHVLPVWDYGEQEGLLYLATPLCDTDLGHLLSDREKLEPEQALSIIAQIAWALDWAHGRGVVHRDVKPENVLLVGGGRGDHAYLADFGLAKSATGTTLTQAGHPAGLTPAYAAPEQWRGDVVGPAADQYALAATLYTCLTGHPPFHPRRGPSLREAHLHEAPPDVSGVVGGVPEGLAASIARGLAKEPGRRFATCRELVAAAEASLHRRPTETAVDRPRGGEADALDVGGTVPSPAVSDLTPTAPVADAQARVPTARRRRTLVIAGAVAAAALAVLAAVLVLGSGGGGGSSPPAGKLVRLAVGRAPIDLAAGAGGVFAANSGSDTLTRIAPRRGVVKQGAVDAVHTPFGVAVGEGRTWAVGPDGELAALDPETGARLAHKALGIQADGIAAGYGAVWIFNGTGGTVTRVDVRSGHIRMGRTVRVGLGTTDVAVGFGAVWVTNAGSATLVKLDPRTAKVIDTIRLRGGISGVATGNSAVWVSNPGRGRVIRVDPATGAAKRFAAGRVADDADVAVGDGAVFYVNHDDGTATRLDPATGRRVGAPVRVTASPSSAVVAAHTLWVADIDRGIVAGLRF
ncbi:MAG TPA: serine/threonine-protein kinase [Solirubrobacteraceae bacterium]